MGGVVSSVTGKDKKRDAENRAAQAAQEAQRQKQKLLQERDEMARIAGERQASSRRARRGGILSEARLGGEESTLGSVR